MKAKKGYSIDGSNLTSAHRVLDLVFGEALISVKINNERSVFEIVVIDCIDNIDELSERIKKKYPSFEITIATVRKPKINL